MLLFCLFDLLSEEFLSFGEEGKFFGVMDGGGHEDVIVMKGVGLGCLLMLLPS